MEVLTLTTKLLLKSLGGIVCWMEMDGQPESCCSGGGSVRGGGGVGCAGLCF